jgi:hypothetical protein
MAAGRPRLGEWRHGASELWLAIELTGAWMLYDGEDGPDGPGSLASETRRRRFLQGFQHTMMRITLDGGVCASGRRANA